MDHFGPSRRRLTVGLVAGLCAFGACCPALAQEDGDDDLYGGMPKTLTITGVVRDFRAANEQGGHADFQVQPSGGAGWYIGCVADELDADGKPVFASTGYRVVEPWTDASGNAIIPPRDYIDPWMGDIAGEAKSEPGGALTGSGAFAQWFRDVPGVNAARVLSLKLTRPDNSNVYTFDDAADATYIERGGFFPINGELFGNYANTGKNFHFTFELESTFTYQQSAGQYFTFTGDDAVWVFIDGRLVIDLGGLHGQLSQTIHLDRLPWLEDGHEATLRLFFAERHTSKSTFRIDTTIPLRNAKVPAVTALYD